MAIPIPDDVRELLQAPSYVHLPTLRADGSPRNWPLSAVSGAGPAAFTLFRRHGGRPPAATGAQLGEPGDAPADHGQS